MQGKRHEILLGVWRVIAERGLDAVSIRSVATAAGVSPGRVQHYFASKQELVRASVAHVIELAAEMNPAATGGDYEDPETMWALLLHSLGPADQSRVGTSVYYSYLAASVADPWIADLLAEAKGSLIEEVRRCLVAQLPGLDDPTAVARQLVLLSDGATQAVFLGALSAAEARGLVEQAVSAHARPGVRTTSAQ